MTSFQRGGATRTRRAAPEPRHRAVGEIVDRLECLAGERDVSVERIVSSFGPSSVLAMLLVPALLVVSPLSGVPLFSSICGISIVAIASQILLGRDHVWLPQRIMRLHLSGARMKRANGILRRIAGWLDRLSRPRLQPLVHPPMSALALALCILAGLTMPVLEFVPFSSSLLGAMVSLIAVGLLVGDGIFVVAGLVFGAVAGAVPFFVITAVVSP
ncbi:exopolysaccharide biosynthesis protein [Oceaniglobus indicus]|uniref:exopolysaccharide biosynthesis protein n=1 Tax=Oceaniglobus indicus TaxID=2047749 RepID=UPI000C18B031|nr:exopolysaccharide biosynthesis protein [Oceaniglobus indicus]